MCAMMKMLWDSKTVDQIVGSKSSMPWSCIGISIDTRTLKEGDLFVALQGEQGNGHDYLEQALQKGAAAALVSESVDGSLPTLCVEDTLKALEQMGVAGQRRASALRIAVTGSVGKTGTKEMLICAFKSQGRTHGNVSSYNNHWGVPLTLARMPADTQFGVFELGMNHPGEIRCLTHMVQPHISIITNVVESHIGFFNSEQEIAAAKAEIFEGMEKGGYVILNRDNPHYTFLRSLAEKRGLKVYSFGEAANANFRLLSWDRDGIKCKVTAEIEGTYCSYTLPSPGIHWAINSLAVLGTVFLAGADVSKAAESLSSVEVPMGRGQHYKGHFTIIDESYNANPASMRAALKVLGESGEGRKIAVIGDMRELGSISQQRHEDLRDAVLQNQIDLVFCCGPYMAYLYESLPQHLQGAYAENSHDLIPHVCRAVQSGDIITVKASLGTRVKPIVEALLMLQQEQGPKRG